MQNLLKFVNNENKEWVSKMTLKQFGHLLNTLSLIPNMKNNTKKIKPIVSISKSL